ncbi:MAG: hypothetical protein HGA87_01495 [Desulfobulbaceae bacterium]|nr:hypothetical protein [Desulfobulbaceae bacterium]
MAEEQNTELQEQQNQEQQLPPDSLLNEQQPVEGEKPAWADDTMWDAEKKALNVEALAKGYQDAAKRAEGLRKKLSEAPHKAPEKPEDYKIPTIEDETIAAAIPQDDAVLGKFRGIAKEAGVSQAQFEKLMTGFFGLVAETGIPQQKELTAEEMAEYRSTELAKLGEGGARVAYAVTEWLESQHKSGFFSETDKAQIGALCSTAEGLAVMNKIRSAMGGSDIPTTVTVEDGLPSDREIHALHAKALKSGDPEEIAKAERLFERRAAAGRSEYLNV